MNPYKQGPNASLHIPLTGLADSTSLLKMPSFNPHTIKRQRLEEETIKQKKLLKAARNILVSINRYADEQATRLERAARDSYHGRHFLGVMADVTLWTYDMWSIYYDAKAEQIQKLLQSLHRIRQLERRYRPSQRKSAR